MNNLEQIIAEARKNLVCPVCGRSYEASEIRLRGFLDHAYIIQTVCHNGHMPLVTVFVATSQPGQTPTFTPRIQPLRREKVTVDDVIESHAILDKFSGDIGQLWPQPPEKK